MKASFLLALCISYYMTGMDLFAQSAPRTELCFLWYNVENLFYPGDDSIPGDDEFTPEGLRHWSWFRYRQKLTALAKVIIASGRGDPPELVGLCEVENARVMEELSTHPILAPYNYSYVHAESMDHRGMDLACLIRRDKILPMEWETIPFTYPVKETRDMMHLVLGWKGDTLDLFLLHLLSKYGGAGATADLRRMQAGQAVHVLDSVYSARTQALIMVAGDFNDAYQGYSMAPFRSARFGGDSLVALLSENVRASYKFRGRWIHLDQILVLSSVHLQSAQVTALELAPLLIEDLQYGGIKPRRTYEGFRYRGGISDHLPLVTDFYPSFFSAPAGQ